MGCDWTQVRRWRKRAVAEGLLQIVDRYVPHRLATTFYFSDEPTETECPTRNVPLKPTNGLVVHPERIPQLVGHTRWA